MDVVNNIAKKFGFTFLLLVSVFAFNGCENAPEVQGDTAALKTLTESLSEKADGLLLKFDVNSSSDLKVREAILDSLGLKEVNAVSELAPGWYRVVQKDDSVTLSEAYNAVLNASGIIAAEPNYFVYAHNTFVNDPLFYNQVALHNEGQTGGLDDVDIDLPEAWDIQQGKEIVVAILDTGIDYNHEDLFSNIWTNAKEIPDNGIDDDLNGYVDDVNGWNFLSNVNVPGDDNGHGTHVAGIIAAENNNDIGVAGINHNAKLMPVKVLNSQGVGTISNAVQALQYAINNGAALSNLSWGVPSFSQVLYDAIENAGAKNHLIVTSAGNDGLDLDPDVSPIYPAAYDLKNVISVAASNERAQLASFSNYSSSGIVHIAAPGVGILSTLMRDSVQDGYPLGYGVMSGTSAAAAIVSGVASLILSQDNSLTPWEIKQALYSGSDRISSLATKVASGGLVNAYGAVTQFTYTGWADQIDVIENNAPISAPIEDVEEVILPVVDGGISLSPANLSMSVNDTIEFMLSGGVPPYRFDVSDANIGVIDDNGIFTAKNTGETQVVVTDADGVVSNVSSILVTSLSFANADISSMLVGEFVELQVVGGLGPYQWAISGDKSAVSLSVDEIDSSYAVVNALQPGNFEIHVIDTNANSVLAHASNSISVQGFGVFIDVPTTTSLLVDDQMQLKSTTNGRYVIWESSKPDVATVDVNGLVIARSKGTTTITVTDEFNQIDSIVVTVNELPVSIAVPLTDSVWVGSVNNKVQLTVQGGVAPYSWTSASTSIAMVDNNGLVTAANFSPSSISDASRKVEIVVTDANGNTNSMFIVVNKTYISSPKVALDVNGVVVLDVLAYGANIQWGVSGSGSASINTSTHSMTAATVGVVVVTITDENGNTAWTEQISINALPLVVMEPVTRELWLGNVNANNLTLVARDGLAPYSWVSSDTNVVTVDSVSGKVTAKGVGQTQVRVTDSLGNTNAISLNVKKFEITSSTFQIDAYDQLQLSANGVGSLIWSVSDPGFSSISSSGLLTTTGSGSVTVSVSDGIGNTASKLVSVSALQSLAIDSGFNTTLWVGGNDNVQLFASGGKAPYVWSVSSSSSEFASVDQNGVVSALKSGVATIIVKDSLNNTDTVQLDVAIVSLSAAQSSVDELDSVQLTAIGFGNISFSVSGSGNATINATTRVLTATKAGDIVVTMTDANGSTSTTNIKINAVPDVSINSVSSNVIWLGDSANSIDLSANGGKGTYTWSVKSGSNVVSVNSSTGLVKSKETGTATIKVTDAYGRTDTINITVKTVSIDGSSSVTITEGDTYQFSGVGSGQLSWSTSNTSLATINSSGRL
ncbi:MAG: S8 family serine peptidase, partial [Gammaproteobacteria bacterium]|nr:S8 family serine peptidase [Gammaproteobacteria bacterium]